MCAAAGEERGAAQTALAAAADVKLAKGLEAVTKLAATKLAAVAGKLHAEVVAAQADARRAAQTAERAAAVREATASEVDACILVSSRLVNEPQGPLSADDNLLVRRQGARTSAAAGKRAEAHVAAAEDALRRDVEERHTALRDELVWRLRRKADTHDVMGRHAELTEKLTGKVTTRYQHDPTLKCATRASIWVAVLLTPSLLQLPSVPGFLVRQGRSD